MRHPTLHPESAVANFISQNGGDASYADLATDHAQTTLKSHFRADNSSFHLVNYNSTTGAVIGKQTVQGFADSSAWARGQSWGLYGYSTGQIPGLAI